MGKLVVLIALVLCPALSAGDINKKLPDLALTVSTGCHVSRVLDTRTKKEAWQVVVWARHAGSDPEAKEDWKLWYSTRTKRMKALKDCDKWLERVAKKIKASRSQ
ncbi:hypothetical protein LCGC14_2410370 [marine sediment metagenome]|uniref:Uncharacterized protein n=1 Tax=marine sediment metagenome TaxID=412755 RepID=A0A0F9BSR4_9ZZZZ